MPLLLLWDRVVSPVSVLVVVVPLITDRLAQAEGEDDAEDLDGDDAHGNADHHVQVANHVAVDHVVAALEW